MDEVNDVYQSLTSHLHEHANWKRPDVGVACYLFCFMLEIAWWTLGQVASKTAPEPFAKDGASRGTWKLALRKKVSAEYSLEGTALATLPPPIKKRLTEAMTRWVPHEDGRGRIVYNKIGFWMHTLRFLRVSPAPQARAPAVASPAS